jgi:hypothetical protein
MAAPTTPPDRVDYEFVLRTYRAYDATIPRLASTYEETAHSYDITHPDGERRPTIFIKRQTARDRLVKEGWEDVTEAWDRAAEWAKSNPQHVDEAAPAKGKKPIVIRS